MPRSRIYFAILLVLGAGCGSPPPAAEIAGEPAPAAGETRPPLVDLTAEAGLDFVHFNGMTGELYFPEMMGPGGALFDADGDGDLDLYLVQGALLGPGKTLGDALFPPRHGELTDRLYRNDLGAGGPRFTDVTAAGGLPEGYGMGVAAGDYDGDGDVDLYVTRFGSNQLLRNDGAGAGGGVAFTDVTAEGGVDDPAWSVAATFFDADRDGRLDLFVGNYVDFRFANHKPCYSDSGALDYCSPGAYEPVPDRLFHNRGDGTFEDVSLAAGIRSAAGAALGAAAADFDHDGWIDLFVANDGSANFLWRNRGGAATRFEDAALLAGCALSGDGKAEASMGVAVGDADGDGDEDLLLSHLVQETHTLYLNDGGGSFRDATLTSGLGAPSWPFTGFGTSFFDLDNDGWLDLFVATGAVTTVEALAAAGDAYPLHQPNQLFRNLGGGRFEDFGPRAGEAFKRSEVSRGAAFGDLDNDGDTDLVVINNNGPARVLINKLGQDRSWLGLRLVAGEPARDEPGARAGVTVAGGRPLWRTVRTGGSYASANDPRLLFGLGDAERVDRVRIVWPDGFEEIWRDPAVGRYTTLVRGSGEAP